MPFDQLCLLAALLSVMACGGPTSVTEDDFTIGTTGHEVVLRNGAGGPTFYRIIERETAAVLDFVTCVLPHCPHVAPSATVRVRYGSISGYRPHRREAIVYWWRSVPSPSGPQADGLRITVIEL